jgi:ATPase family associated with various cellular activities (AAA)
MIKALAQYTGRSIVNVPLTRITTNSELMDIFYEKKYHVRGEDVPIKLGFKDVIFVLEDVDAASKVVRRRVEKQLDSTPLELVDVPKPKSVWKMLLESNSENCRELVTMLMEKSERLREAAQSDVLESIARRMTTVPGLSLIGEGSEDEALSQIEAKAVEKANQLITSMDAADHFLGAHAQTLMHLLEADIEVTDDFVDELLGTSIVEEPHLMAIERAPFQTRTIFNRKYDDAMEEAIFEADGNTATVAATVREMSDSKDAKADAKGSRGKELGPSLWSKPIKDQLNLTGLLNVLDGVVDTPGRILIMTTNHPEMLDPAIIRPGRIDKKILLGYMCAIDVMSMLEHYFLQSLTSEQKTRMEDLISGGFNLTPAQVEQMTAEYEEVEDMVRALESRSQFRATRRGSSLRSLPLDLDARM